MKRIKKDGFLSWRLVVLHPKNRVITRVLGKIFNKLLLISFFPVFVLGIYALCSGYSRAYVSEGNFWITYFISIFLSMTLHEIAHSCAAWDYGGKVNEMGLLLSPILPGAYVELEYGHLKNRFHRTQIVAAGVEMNLFLAGFSLCLSVFPKMNYYFLFIFFVTNLLLALVNLTLVYGIDGMHIFSEMIGTDNMIVNALFLILDRNQCRKLKKRGVNGRATVFVSKVVLGIQILLPILVVVNIAAIFLG